MSNLVFKGITVNGRPTMIGNRAAGVFRLAPNTFRLLYKDGVTPTFTKGTAVQISSTPNIWDWTGDTYRAFIDHTDLLEVMDAGNMSAQTDFRYTFQGCTSLRYVCPFNARINRLSYMFQNCSSLTSVPYLNVNIASGYDFIYMFDSCSSLTSVPLIKITNTGATTTNYMFRNCSSLTSIPQFDLRGVSSTASMFEGCTSLSTVPALNLNYAFQLNSMFKGCTSLTTMPSLSFSRTIQRCISMFEGCINIESGILDMYSALSAKMDRYGYYTTCFKDCGSNTTTGAAELAQIPSAWK